MKNRIVVASTNAGKIAEFAAMLDDQVDWVGLSEFASITEVEEDGETFAENARKKAIGYAKQTGLWTIADDSGLVVDAIGGEPGVHSARFSGEKIKDEQRGLLDHRNMSKVLELLKSVPSEKRTARFVCHLCLADRESVLLETEGILEGFIAENEAGANGFGYDPIFLPAGSDKTVAQLSAEEKNSISHRGNAISKFKPKLDQFLQINC